MGSFVGDRLLFESVIEQGFNDSGVTATFLHEAFEFGRFQAELGARIPVIHAALNTITTRLRMLFLLNTFVSYSIRDESQYATVTGRDRDDALSEIHRILYRAAQIPDKKDFGAACKLIEEFSHAASAATDKRLLRVMHAKTSLLRRFVDFLRRRKERRDEAKDRKDVLQKLRQNFAADFPALGIAAEEILRKTTAARESARELERSADRTIHEFRGTSAGLDEAMREFLEKTAAETNEDIESLRKLLQLKIDGVDDPDIDLFIAASTNATELLQRALDRGGNEHVRIGEVLRRHQAK